MRAIVLVALAACLAAEDRPARPLAGLQIRVVESSGPAHVLGSRSSSAMVVEISGPRGEPVSGATVSFQLPASGPGGAFSNGLTSDIVLTGRDGRAAAPSVRWNKTPGTFEIRVTAANGPLRGAAAYPHRLLASATDSRISVSSGRSRRKLVLIVAGVAAGAVTAGLAVGRRASSSTSPTTNAVTGQGVTIGAPVISVGAP